MRALHTAATGMMAQELNVQVISNNIANMRTTGYKRQRAEFQDLLYEHVRRVGTQTSDAGQHPAGRHRSRRRRQDRRHAAPDDARHAGRRPATTSTSPSAAKASSRSQMPDGTFAYTRDGSFQMDAQGRIVTAQGNVVQPGITIPQNAHVDHDQPAGPGLGDRRRARPRRPCSASSRSRASSTRPACRRSATTCSSKRRPPARRRTACPTPTAIGDLQQGNLEQANVEAVTEISDLIAAQRAYEMNAKVITAADQMLSATSNLMR